MGITKKGSVKCHNKSAKLIKKRIKETINTTTTTAGKVEKLTNNLVSWVFFTF